MTLFDIELLTKYAAKHPPLRLLVQGCAAALGVEFKKPDEKPAPIGIEQARAWAQMANRGMANPNG